MCITNQSGAGAGRDGLKPQLSSITLVCELLSLCTALKNHPHRVSEVIKVSTHLNIR